MRTRMRTSLKRLYHAAISMRSRFVREYPAGHFYSPVPSDEDIRRLERQLAHDVVACPGVDLNDARQLEMLEEIGRFYPELPFSAHPSPPLRYYMQNDLFRHGDAIVLFGMLRAVRPKRVIEVGSGFSSAMMLDTDELFLDRSTRFTFIEPFPERLERLLAGSSNGSVDVMRQRVQDIPLEIFEQLESGDILFIDSSHVVKVGSDVKFLLDEVVPRVAPGVLVHFHDVGWPFEYPLRWHTLGRAWNEAYVLRAFLQFNDTFRIQFFNAYMATVHPDELRRVLPTFMSNTGSSLWLRRDG